MHAPQLKPMLLACAADDLPVSRICGMVCANRIGATAAMRSFRPQRDGRGKTVRIRRCPATVTGMRLAYRHCPAFAVRSLASADEGPQDGMGRREPRQARKSGDRAAVCDVSCHEGWR